LSCSIYIYTRVNEEIYKRAVFGDGGVSRVLQGRAYTFFGGYVRERQKCARVKTRYSDGARRPRIDPTRSAHGSDPFRIKLGTTRRVLRTACSQKVDLCDKEGGREGGVAGSRTKLFLRPANPVVPLTSPLD